MVIVVVDLRRYGPVFQKEIMKLGFWLSWRHALIDTPSPLYGEATAVCSFPSLLFDDAIDTEVFHQPEIRPLMNKIVDYCILNTNVNIVPWIKKSLDVRMSVSPDDYEKVFSADETERYLISPLDVMDVGTSVLLENFTLVTQLLDVTKPSIDVFLDVLYLLQKNGSMIEDEIIAKVKKLDSKIEEMGYQVVDGVPCDVRKSRTLKKKLLRRRGLISSKDRELIEGLQSRYESVLKCVPLADVSDYGSEYAYSKGEFHRELRCQCNGRYSHNTSVTINYRSACDHDEMFSNLLAVCPQTDITAVFKEWERITMVTPLLVRKVRLDFRAIMTSMQTRVLSLQIERVKSALKLLRDIEDREYRKNELVPAEGERFFFLGLSFYLATLQDKLRIIERYSDMPDEEPQVAEAVDWVQTVMSTPWSI